MSDNDLKQVDETKVEASFSEPENRPEPVVEVLPPVLRVVPQTRDHQKDEQLGLQIRDLAKHGLSKSSTALTARISTYILEKYYLEEFLEGQAEMQKGLASVAISEAMNGNTPVLLHLLKTKLGWSEQHQIEISGEVRSIVSNKPMSKEEFIQKYLASDTPPE